MCIIDYHNNNQCWLRIIIMCNYNYMFIIIITLYIIMLFAYIRVGDLQRHCSIDKLLLLLKNICDGTTHYSIS